MPRFAMTASYNDDEDGVAHMTSPLSLLNSPHERLRFLPYEDEDGDTVMSDGDEMEVDDAKDAGSQNSLLGKISTAAGASIPSAGAHTIRKFIYTHVTNQLEAHIKDPACSPTPASPISLRAHASLNPVVPDLSLGNDQENGGDDIPLGTLKPLLAARQHLKDARVELIANPFSKWIDIPEFSVSSNVGNRAESEERTFEPREDPIVVLMEVLYPGEGKRILDRYAELGKGAGEKGKRRPWHMQRRGASSAKDWKL